MISRKDLRAKARSYLRDAEALLRAKRFDGAYYICGYAVELALKARICRTLKWPGFPETSGEFRDLQSFRTHNLDLLLKLSGIEDRVTTSCRREWTEVIGWDPQKRYRMLGLSATEASKMITSVEKVLEFL